MKALHWIIALSGLWEFGDITALFVPNFGTIQSFVWNHIIIGLIFMIAGITAARTSNPGTAKTMNGIIIVASVWLIVSSILLRYPVIAAGLWNDIVVGVIVLILGIWIALKSPRVTR
jgi:hypothetical protein